MLANVSQYGALMRSPDIIDDIGEAVDVQCLFHHFGQFSRTSYPHRTLVRVVYHAPLGACADSVLVGGSESDVVTDLGLQGVRAKLEAVTAKAKGMWSAFMKTSSSGAKDGPDPGTASLGIGLGHCPSISSSFGATARAFSCIAG